MKGITSQHSLMLFHFHTEIGAREGHLRRVFFSGAKNPQRRNGCGHGSIFVSRLVTEGELFKGMYTPWVHDHL